VLKTGDFFQNMMHKVKAEWRVGECGELFVKNMLILQNHIAMLDLEAPE